MLRRAVPPGTTAAPAPPPSPLPPARRRRRPRRRAARPAPHRSPRSRGHPRCVAAPVAAAACVRAACARAGAPRVGASRSRGAGEVEQREGGSEGEAATERTGSPAIDRRRRGRLVKAHEGRKHGGCDRAGSFLTRMPPAPNDGGLLRFDRCSASRDGSRRVASWGHLFSLEHLLLPSRTYHHIVTSSGSGERRGGAAAADDEESGGGAGSSDASVAAASGGNTPKSSSSAPPCDIYYFSYYLVIKRGHHYETWHR